MNWRLRVMIWIARYVNAEGNSWQSQFMPVRAIHCNSLCELLACLFDSNCNSNSHTNHGVVTCADQTHHFGVVRVWGREERFSIFSKKSCNVRSFCDIILVKSLLPNTSFESLLNALYRVLRCLRTGQGICLRKSCGFGGLLLGRQYLGKIPPERMERKQSRFGARFIGCGLGELGKIEYANSKRAISFQIGLIILSLYS